MLLDAIFIAVWMSLMDGVAPVSLTVVSMCFSIFCVVVFFIILVVGRSGGPHSPGGPLSLCSTVTPSHLPFYGLRMDGCGIPYLINRPRALDGLMPNAAAMAFCVL